MRADNPRGAPSTSTNARRNTFLREVINVLWEAVCRRPNLGQRPHADGSGSRLVPLAGSFKALTPSWVSVGRRNVREARTSGDLSYVSVVILLTLCSKCTALPGCCPPYHSSPPSWSRAGLLASFRAVLTTPPAWQWRILPTPRRPLQALVLLLEKHPRLLRLLAGCHRHQARVNQWSRALRPRSQLNVSGSLRHLVQCFASPPRLFSHRPQKQKPPSSRLLGRSPPHNSVVVVRRIHTGCAVTHACTGPILVRVWWPSSIRQNVSEKSSRAYPACSHLSVRADSERNCNRAIHFRAKSYRIAGDWQG